MTDDLQALYRTQIFPSLGSEIIEVSLDRIGEKEIYLGIRVQTFWDGEGRSSVVIDPGTARAIARHLLDLSGGPDA